MAKKRVSKKKKAKFVDPFELEGKRLRVLVDDFSDNIEDEEMLVADGFDAAIVGITESCEPIIVYDWDKCVEILRVRDEMTEEDAIEHMSFNVTGAYVGSRTPLFIRFL